MSKDFRLPTRQFRRRESGSAVVAEPFPETAPKGPETSPTASYIAPDLRALAVPIDAVRPMPGNARAHGERDVAAIADSLRAHGQQRPIVVARRYRGAENAIIAGCGTWAGAKRLDWRFIAVSWFSGDDQAAAAYSVRDNRLSELSSWNPEALITLQADGLDLLSLWHDDAGLADLLHDGVAPPRFEPEAPAHRLDELADNMSCPACGHSWRQGTR